MFGGIWQILEGSNLSVGDEGRGMRRVGRSVRKLLNSLVLFEMCPHCQA